MKKRYFILFTAAVLLSLSSSAQSFRSGYFLDNYVFGYRINPAQVNDRSSFGLLFDNIDLQNASSIGVSSLLYPNPDGSNSLVTGLNKAISTETFLSRIKNHNFVTTDNSFNIFSIAIADGRKMHSVELNARVSATVSIPKSYFALLKSGKSGTYDLSDLYADASVLTDISYGYSTYVGEQLSVGGRFHLLAGLANANLRCNGSSITMDDKAIVAGANIELNASGMVSFRTDQEGNVDMEEVHFEPSSFGNFGAALDLGAEYKSDFGLDAMVSITDLGAISWENKLSARATGTVEFDGFFGEGGTLKTDMEDLVDLNNAFDYRVVNGHRKLRMMPCNIAAGARYHMPFWSGLSVGLLNTFHIARASSWYEMRVGATVTPARILSVSGNLGLGTVGPTWGTALNLNLGPFNLLAGVDSFLGPLGKVDSAVFPVNSFVTNVHAGIVLTLK